jgi:tRNA A37 threonylcarbamoyladenosine biosynthesis protein TsaE
MHPEKALGAEQRHLIDWGQLVASQLSEGLLFPGRIILLNGASSSGKSTLARGLQAALEEPFWKHASTTIPVP